MLPDRLSHPVSSTFIDMGKAKERIAYKLKMGLLPGLHLRLGLQTQQPGIVREKVANSSTSGLL